MLETIELIVSNIFPTPIWHFKVDIPEDLIDRIHKLRDVSAGREYSNIGGWQSKDIDNDPNFKDITTTISDLLPAVYKDIYTAEDRKPKLLASWFNINMGDNINAPHVHPHNHIAGCLYIKCNENSGPIQFQNPMSDLMIHYDLNPTTVDETIMQWNIKYKPTVGEILFFPAWLYHSVLASSDNEERISMAFNTALR
jgi:uncharacterized protein (TIGR02466 family)